MDSGYNLLKNPSFSTDSGLGMQVSSLCTCAGLPYPNRGGPTLFRGCNLSGFCCRSRLLSRLSFLRSMCLADGLDNAIADQIPTMHDLHCKQPRSGYHILSRTYALLHIVRLVPGTVWFMIHTALSSQPVALCSTIKPVHLGC
jgi:hypothetical protein